MKTLSSFISEQKESSDKVFVVYFGDKTMYNFYYNKDEADKEAEALNKETEENKAFVKEEPRSNIEKNA